MTRARAKVTLGREAGSRGASDPWPRPDHAFGTRLEADCRAPDPDPQYDGGAHPSIGQRQDVASCVRDGHRRRRGRAPRRGGAALPVAGQGAGGVHHVAFRTPSVEALHQWTERLASFKLPSSGEVERYYFRSLYFREPNGILFEIATDGPGLRWTSLESLGQRLSLPPFLEARRASIEAGLKPLHETRFRNQRAAASSRRMAFMSPALPWRRPQGGPPHPWPSCQWRSHPAPGRSPRYPGLCFLAPSAGRKAGIRDGSWRPSSPMSPF